MAEPIINAEIHGFDKIIFNYTTKSNSFGIWTIPNELSLLHNCEYILFSSGGNLKYSESSCNLHHKR